MAINCNLGDRQLTQLLMHGGVGVLPTDTVYGLVCRASDPSAVAKLYEVKQRAGKPGTIIASSAVQLEALGVGADELKRARPYWPGSTSIELHDNLEYLNQGTGHDAYRVIGGSSALISILNITGPLLTTSANMPGEPTANTIAEARRYFDDTIDFYVDGGDMSGNLPSTLIAFVDGKPKVLREGAATIDSKGETA